MVVVGTAVFHHGSLVFDGDKHSPSEGCRTRHAELEPSLRNKFQEAFEDSCSAGSTVASWEPDLIILSTPHGLSLTDSLAVYWGEVAKGSALFNTNWSDMRVNVDLDAERSKLLLSQFRQDGVPAQRIFAYASAFVGGDTLGWAEVVPLWFILRGMKKQPKVIIISEPESFSPLEGAYIATVDELRLNAGHSLARFVSQLEEQLRVAVVSSGDLSHLYPTDCTTSCYLPLLKFPFEANGAAVLFEKAMKGWAEASTITREGAGVSSEGREWTAQHALPWLQEACRLTEVSLPCGISGAVMLHGLMESLGQQGYTIRPKVELCQAPTYFGLMCASFETYLTGSK